MSSPADATFEAHLLWMEIALEEARKGAREGEVPVGAVLVRDGIALAAAHNCPIALNDPTAHAEILVLRTAGGQVGNYRFPGSTLYVTLEPCLMCAGALLHARVARAVFGAADPRGGGVESAYRVLKDSRLNHRVEVVSGVRADESQALLQEFFLARRRAPISCGSG